MCCGCLGLFEIWICWLGKGRAWVGSSDGRLGSHMLLQIRIRWFNKRWGASRMSRICLCGSGCVWLWCCRRC